jgi:hypothetical protein
MGFDFGLASAEACFKRKNRWIFSINGIIADESPDGINSLPPSKAARPSLQFKEIEAQHLNETVYYPGKPEWKPITITLYDMKKNNHPIFKWLLEIYEPDDDELSIYPSTDGFKKEAKLTLFDGCGEKIEEWIFENAWPQNIEFGELEMSSSEVVTCDLTIRYDRAYIR